MAAVVVIEIGSADPPRAGEILECLKKRVGGGYVEPKDAGRFEIYFADATLAHASGAERTRHALDECANDWREHLSVLTPG